MLYAVERCSNLGNGADSYTIAIYNLFRNCCSKQERGKVAGSCLVDFPYAYSHVVPVYVV